MITLGNAQRGGRPIGSIPTNEDSELGAIIILFLYNLLFLLAFVLYLPLFIYKLVRRGGYSRSFWERFGVYTAMRKRRLRGLRRPVWIHAVSVGEVVAAVTFIRRWQERHPELDFVLSTTTTTGHATAEKKLPENVVLIYCPLDFFFSVGRVLTLVKPQMLVIFEVEIWPNLIMRTVWHDIPVVLANGRMSDNSARGYARHKWFFCQLFSQFSVICVQSEVDADRARRVVGDRVPVYACNTMKFDQIPDVAEVDKTAVLDGFFGEKKRIVWTAGSTHSGEEALVAKTFRQLQADFPMLKLVLVPRHHERTAEVEKVLQDNQLSYRLLCQTGETADKPGQEVDVLLVNTTGELMNFYGASDIVFVGKCLAGNEGGHNIIEPAIFGKPIIHGSNMQNFRAVAQIFRERNATVEVAADAELCGAMRKLISDGEKRQELGHRARHVVDDYRGAIDRTLDQIKPLTTPVHH